MKSGAFMSILGVMFDGEESPQCFEAALTPLKPCRLKPSESVNESHYQRFCQY